MRVSWYEPARHSQPAADSTALAEHVVHILNACNSRKLRGTDAARAAGTIMKIY
jgi:hypothetical protein